MNTKLVTAAIALSIASIASAACRKSAEEERKEAARAAQEMQKETAEAELHAAEVAREGRIEAMEERNELLAAVRREQLDYREKLHEELDAIDQQLAEKKIDVGRDGVVTYQGNDPKVKELVARRSTLRSGIDALENSTEQSWESVKSQLDKLLGEGASKANRGRM